MSFFLTQPVCFCPLFLYVCWALSLHRWFAATSISPCLGRRATASKRMLMWGCACHSPGLAAIISNCSVYLFFSNGWPLGAEKGAPSLRISSFFGLWCMQCIIKALKHSLNICCGFCHGGLKILCTILQTLSVQTNHMKIWSQHNRQRMNLFPHTHAHARYGWPFLQVTSSVSPPTVENSARNKKPKSFQLPAIKRNSARKQGIVHGKASSVRKGRARLSD